MIAAWVSALRVALDDASPDVRLTALWALGQIDDDRDPRIRVRPRVRVRN